MAAQFQNQREGIGPAIAERKPPIRNGGTVLETDLDPRLRRHQMRQTAVQEARHGGRVTRPARALADGHDRDGLKTARVPDSAGTQKKKKKKNKKT